MEASNNAIKWLSNADKLCEKDKDLCQEFDFITNLLAGRIK
jgi:hypothetical protein